MSKLDAFQEIIRTNVPMSSLTWLRLGGPIEYVAEPRSEEELIGVLQACAAEKIEARALGEGSNILASSEGAPGLAIRLCADAFCKIEFEGPYATAGGGVKLGKLATATAGAGLAGLEGMVGIPGTVGAGVVSNASTHDAALEQYVESVRVASYDGKIFDLSKDELVFGIRSSNLENYVVVAVKFKLIPDSPEELIKSLQKIWIVRQKNRPELEQGGYARMFRNPQGCGAAELIADAGFAGTRIGGAAVCESDPNLVVADASCSAEDVKRLIALIEKQVNDAQGVALEREIEIW